MEGRRDSRKGARERHRERDWHLGGDLLVRGGTGLLLEAGVSLADVVEKLPDRGKGTCLTLPRAIEMEKHVLHQCTKCKAKCTCYKEAIVIENSSSGKRVRKRHIHLLHIGSYYKEMTEHSILCSQV